MNTICIPSPRLPRCAGASAGARWLTTAMALLLAGPTGAAIDPALGYHALVPAWVRRSLLALALLAGLLVGTAAWAVDAWQPTNGPSGGTISSLVVDPATPATLYAGAAAEGVLKSTDGGTHWSAVNSGLAGSSVYVLAIDPVAPATLYTGTNRGGAFKSVNGGASWSAINSGLANDTVMSLAIDPATPATLYAGTDGGGVFKSVNGGASWSAVNSGLANGTVLSLAIDPATPATLYAGTGGGGVFKSVNGGANWVAVNTGLVNLSVRSLVIDPATPATLVAGLGGGGGVAKSIDGGAHWSAVNSGLPAISNVQSLAIDPRAPATLYVGIAGSGVFKRTDGAAGWSQVASGLANGTALSLAIHPATPDTLYAGTNGGGVFKSTNGGVHWSGGSSGMALSYVYSFAIDPVSPATLYAGTAGGVFKSTNGGADWAAVNIGLTNSKVYSLAIDPATPGTLYAGTDGEVFKSVNGGANWAATGSGLANLIVRSLAIDPATPATLYAGAGGDVFKSVNGGANWAATGSGITGLYVQSLVIDPATPATLYAGTVGSGGVFKSVDGGAHWSAVRNGMTSSGVFFLVIDPVTPATLYAGTGDGVFKSTNGAAQWSQVNNGLTSTTVRSLAIDPVAPATLYAGTDAGGVFKSTSGGDTWGVANSGLTSGKVYSMAIDTATPASLYAATFGDAVFKSTNRALASDAYLSGLVLDAGSGPVALAPAFDSATTSYSATVAGAASATLAPTSRLGDATITIQGAPVASGAASAALPLNGGANTLTVVVTSGDGYSTQTYTVAVTRLTVPGVPTAVAAVPGNAQASVTWAAPASDGGSAITAYTVTAVADATKGCTVNTGSPLPTTCTVAGLANGTAYAFTVKATNAWGGSAASVASAAVTPVAPADPGPVAQPVSIGSPGTVTIADPSVPIVVGPGAGGATLVLPGTGTTPVRLDVTINGQPLQVLALPGSQLRIAQVDGQSVLVLVVLQGWASMASTSAGQPMALAGAVLLRSGQAGTTIEAQPLAVAVLVGALLPPEGALAPLGRAGLQAGERLQVNEQGAVVAITLGSLKGDTTQPGDAMAFANLPALITVDRSFARLNGPLARLSGANLAQGLETAPSGVLLVRDGGQVFQLLPVLPITIDATQPDGLAFTPLGLLRWVHAGVVVQFAPAVADLAGLAHAVAAALPDARIRLGAEGVIQLRTGGRTYVLKPGWTGSGTATGTAQIGVDGQPGRIYLQVGQGARQWLLPSLLSYTQAQAVFQAAMPGAALAVQPGNDGAFTVTLAGQPWRLVPEWVLPEGDAAQLQAPAAPWWMGADGLLYLKLGTQVQGVRVAD